jgi:hypothetical protein
MGYLRPLFYGIPNLFYYLPALRCLDINILTAGNMSFVEMFDFFPFIVTDEPEAIYSRKSQAKRHIIGRR